MKQGATGLYARLAGDSAITALLRVDPDTGGALIHPGWPEEELEGPRPDDYPRIAHLLPTLAPLADGVGEFDAEIHLFVWPEGEAGGRARMDALEKAVRAHDQAHWRHDGARLHLTLGPTLDDPSAAADQPHHRVIPGSLLVSEE